MNNRIEKLKSTLTNFSSTLDNVSKYETLKENFVGLTTELVEFLHDLEKIDKSDISKEEHLRLNYLKFEWSLDAIDLSILLRDSLLSITNKQLSAFSVHDRVNDDEEFDSKIVIDPALLSVLQNAITETEFTLTTPVEIKPEWKHQRSPISTICDQMNALVAQEENMADIHELFLTIIPKFNNYREHVLEYNSFRLTHLTQLRHHVLQAKELLVEQPSECDPQELAVLSASMKKVSNNIENEKVLSLLHEDFVTDSGELEVPIYADGGELFYRAVELDKNVESWTDSEILPKILDADADISNLYDSVLISLFNTGNKIESLGLAGKEVIDFESEPLLKSIEKNLTEINKYYTNLEEVICALNVRTATELRFEKIFDKQKEFLPELGFINLTKLTGQKIWYESDIWTDLKMKGSQLLASRKIPFLNALGADPYDFIESKEIDEQDLDSNSLFLKKGYLGRSFYIQRESIENQIVEAYDRWQDGFQGSVLIKGDYGSGKSCLMEYMPQLLPKVKVININLHNTIQLLGRKHTITYKLSDTISFISKLSITTPVVACIDDIERWQYKDQTMYNTVRDLIEGIAKYGRRIFFVVSTNHFMNDYIERMFNFSSRFASCIEVDTMFQKSIANALVIRHNASIKDYNQDDNLSLGKKAAKIARKNNYNIGASMLAWEKSVVSESTETILAPPSFYQLVRRHELILKSILINKLLNETVLRHSLSSADNNYISEELRKLMGYKIVRRTFDGNLQINPSIVFYVEDCLKVKN